MGRAILVFAVVALAVTAFAAVSYGQCAAPTVSVSSCVQAPACPEPCPAPVACPTCPPLGEQKWTANLTPLPGVACSGASGNVDFQLNREGTEIRYWVHVNNVNNVNGAQVRLLTPGMSPADVANAPVVANLYNGPAREGCSTGRLSRGKISACDLTGPLAGQPLSALAIALTNCTAIVTVGTCQSPCGEIAGLAAPTTGQTVACYTGAAVACSGLGQACQVACAPVTCVTCAPVAQACVACPAPVTTACAPATVCAPIRTAAVDLQPYWKTQI